MLSIGKLSTGQERYYLEQAGSRVDVVTSVAGGVEDYYAGDQEAPGGWAGAGAARLGLTGSVDAAALRSVLAGCSPAGGESLRTRAVRVAGFDLTFSAPKSVSLLFGIGDERVTVAVRGAHDHAVGEALGYLERSAARVRRGAGGATVLPADGLIAAAFRHRTSRLGDPQLHTHVLVANLAHGPDGRWSALDGRALFAHARAASFIYQAVLRGQLTRELGVQWTPVRDGIAEIDGIPARTSRAFSQRRAQIEQALEERGLEGPRAAEVAALATRHAKVMVRPEKLIEEWRMRAAVHGFPVARISRVLDRVAERHVAEEDWARAFDALAGPGGLTAQRSSFTRRDVIDALCDRIPAGVVVDAGALERAASRFLATGHVVALADGRDAEAPGMVFVRRDGRVLPVDPAELRYSTHDLLAVERRVIGRSLAGVGAHAGVADPAAVRGALERRPSLSDEQAAMIGALAAAGDRVAVVVGRAGTGKTFALAACHDAWRASGHCVIGAAVARRAARELEDQAGIASTSIAALTAGLQSGKRLPPGAVVVVDEAGMVGTRDLATILHAVETVDGKLVLVGDHRQLPSIDAGGAFHALARQLPSVEPTSNRRQTQAWEREAVELVRDGRGHEALQHYRDHDRLHIEPTTDQARERLVGDWWSAGDPDQAVMIALRRADVADLNQRAHELMRAAGRLGPDELELAGGGFAVGDRVLIRRNDPRLGIANGDRGTITAIDPARMSLRVDLGRDRVTLGRDFLTARTDHGDPTLTHGYAITGHAAQGLTVDRAYILADTALTQEWAYTALTRGREANHLYLPAQQDLARHDYAPSDPPPADPVECLARALSTSRPQDLALEYLSPHGAACEEAERRVAELQTRRDDLQSAATRARAQHQDMLKAPAPVRLLRRKSIARATTAEQTTRAELAELERDLAAATQRAHRLRLEHAPQADPDAVALTRALDRRLTSDRQQRQRTGIER